ncbi:MAG: zinc-binding dehydrogenase [Ignavibacteria bacterium]|nr:zinc-binding dehydrogenase [Ignavibacteria bacterium]
MKQVTQHNKTGEVRVEQVPVPAMKAGHLLVKTRFSVISAGTEKASVSQRKSSLLEKARAHPELILRVLEQVRQYGLLATYRRVKSRLEASAPIGYSASGVVVAVSDEVSEFKPGDRVACAGGGYANHAEFMLIPKHLCARVPKNVDLEDAAYSTLGAIALQGVRQAEPTLGETVVVIGLGLLGQLTVQLLKANGCSVIGIDLDAAAVKLAKECGADVALHRETSDVKNVVRTFTNARGGDAVIITAATRSSDPVELAGELCREKGRVVLVGDVGIRLPRAPYYMKELDFRLSRSYGPGRYDVQYEERGHDYPVGYIRWTEKRNLEEFLRLVSARAVDVKSLTTHRFSIDEARSAYGLITESKPKKREHYVGIVLKYGDVEKEDVESLQRTVELSTEGVARAPADVKIGFLGAGSFAQGYLLPHLQRAREISLVGVCTGNGLNATNVARTFRFEFATTDPREILGKDPINSVFIAARHNLHAPYVVDALKAGKHVFVEKPLALTSDELRSIERAYRSARGRNPQLILMVGFNRRFSPHAQHVKRFFDAAIGPFVIQYRVNAGFAPKTHWTRDPVEGGGRIIGEVCHFVDLMQYITGSIPVKVSAEPLVADGGRSADDDSLVVTLTFRDGSLGTIAYLANGDTSMSKERVEISSTGRSVVIDNFKHLTLYQQGKERTFRLRAVDKGHREEVRLFLQAVRLGMPSPTPFESVVATTNATLKILQSLQLGIPVRL